MHTPDLKNTLYRFFAILSTVFDIFLGNFNEVIPEKTTVRQSFPIVK